jgi:CheY-like chemotaxis protein
VRPKASCSSLASHRPRHAHTSITVRLARLAVLGHELYATCLCDRFTIFMGCTRTSPQTTLHSPNNHIANSTTGGSGLGLFISRRLTEMHGGAIGFSSTPGLGSSFSFYVKSRMSCQPPRLDSAKAVDLSIRTQASVVSSHSTRDDSDAPLRANLETAVPNSELHILVVEDNLVNQRVLAKQLRKLGMHVAVANHGGEALEYLRSTSFCREMPAPASNTLSLILLDWEMPVMVRSSSLSPPPTHSFFLLPVTIC